MRSYPCRERAKIWGRKKGRARGHLAWGHGCGCRYGYGYLAPHPGNLHTWHLTFHPTGPARLHVRLSGTSGPEGAAAGIVTRLRSRPCGSSTFHAYRRGLLSACPVRFGRDERRCLAYCPVLGPQVLRVRARADGKVRRGGLGGHRWRCQSGSRHVSFGGHCECVHTSRSRVVPRLGLEWNLWCGFFRLVRTRVCKRACVRRAAPRKRTESGGRVGEGSVPWDSASVRAG